MSDAKDAKDAKEPVGRKLLDLIGRATADDLAALDAEIGAKRAEVDGLAAVRKLLAARLGEEVTKPRRAARATATGPADAPKPGPNGGDLMTGRRKQVAILLDKRGPLSLAAICSETEIPRGSIYPVLNHHAFDQQGHGTYRLTEIGRKTLIG